MQYAIAPSGNRIHAHPDAQGTCPTCGGQLIPKCGSILIHHWAHRTGPDCDTWSEPESEWHLGWKRALEAAGAETEVTRRTETEWHRADAVLVNGTIVELQHGYLSPEEIRAREAFYGDDLVWLYDAHWASRIVWWGARQLRWRRPAESMLVHRRPVFWHIGAHDRDRPAVVRVQLRLHFGDADPAMVLGGWDPFPREAAFIRKIISGQPCRVCGGPVSDASRTPDCHPSCHEWPDVPDRLRPYGVAS